LNQIKLLPIKVPRQDTKFSLLDLISKSLESNSTELKDGDILCISSKFVALSEGRYVKLSDVDVSSYATEIAEKYNIDPRLSELIVQESDKIFYGFDGFVLTFKDGILVPNAGIDTSNIMPGYAILYPEDSFQSAKILKSEIKKLFNTENAIIITDSRLMPTRIGTTGVAIASSGVKPI
jgi:F420-0:gamma-glutamyl ligase